MFGERGFIGSRPGPTEGGATSGLTVDLESSLPVASSPCSISLGYMVYW